MELTEDQLIEKFGEKYGHCNRNMLLLFEYEWTCYSCVYIVIKWKHELCKIQRKKNFINRSKYAEQKLFSTCKDVYIIYEVDDFDKIYEVLSINKNTKLKKNNILIRKDKNMNENPDFEQEYGSRTATGNFTIGHDSIRLLKWLA